MEFNFILKLLIQKTENRYLKISYFRFVKLKKVEYFITEKKLIKQIKDTVKKDKVICALSGGVDSSVVALLINKAIKKI